MRVLPPSSPQSPARRLPRAVLVLLLLGPSAARAQDTARAPQPVLPPVRVTATREGPRPAVELPYALTVTRPDSLAAARRLGVDELLFAVPGVALANRQNPAQDPRISIRGFGARSAFGVRGVRVLQDGIPATLPDGQTPVDALDIEGADHVEVVRGSAASLYGNAAGGVIDIRSAAPSRLFTPFGRVIGGSASPTITAAGASGTAGALGLTSSITRIVGRGYREYSDQRATRGALRLLLVPGGADARSSATLALRVFDVDRAESPGALTRAQLESDPRQADALSVRKRAGKTVRQGDLSLAASHALGDAGSLDAAVFASTRTLANPLTFAIVDVARASGGATLRASDVLAVGGRSLRLSAGGDAQWQNDDRQESESCIAVVSSAVCAAGGPDRGALRKNQRELVQSAGPFARAELSLAPWLIASAGVRADAVHFQLRDRLVSGTNPDDSGERTLRAVSPSAGLVWRVAPLASVYASASSSFETPTTTELGNKPDGSAGINPDLQPQRTLTLEVGSKGVVPVIAVRWDVALFEARARDELVPFDIPDGAGRRYYRNAGRTLRRGGEVGLEAESGPFTLRSAYSYSRFRYVTYQVGAVSFAGRRIPGVPESALASTLAFRHGALTLSGTADVATAVDVDDANSAQAAGRTVLGLALGTSVNAGGVRLAPLVALQNLTDARSVGSVSVNATGGKFFEPAPGRVLLVRLTLARDAAP